MTDVLTIARERKRELRDEISELDDFIRMAQTLLRDAKLPVDAREAQAPARPAVAAAAETAPEQAAPEQAAHEQAEDDTVEERQDIAASTEAEDADSESGVRKFPWTGQQPAIRRTGTDDTGPTRRNIFRRDMSAAG